MPDQRVDSDASSLCCAESDFYATDAGRQHFADQLKSIRYCVQETCSTLGKSNLSDPTIDLPVMCAQILIRFMRI